MRCAGRPVWAACWPVPNANTLVRGLSHPLHRVICVTLVAGISCSSEEAWREGEHVLSVMGTINLATVDLVRAIGSLDATGGWQGHGIRSLEHWVQWKACVSERRAQNLVRIARRVDDLPRCWGLFSEGRLTEDVMARLARRLPATRTRSWPGWCRS